MYIDSKPPPQSCSKHPLSRAILVVAHPGHELRVHSWLVSIRPVVWVLTDGSGRTQQSRIDSTTHVLASAGAAPGPVYGQLSDLDLYNAALNFDPSRFTQIVDQLANVLIRDEVHYVAGDAEEGYNPAHDICRLIINAAVRLVKLRTKKQIGNYDFALVGVPSQCPEELRAYSIWQYLGDAAFTRKLSAAHNYPELRAEVESAVSGRFETLRRHSSLAELARSNFGVTQANDFRVECLRPVDTENGSSTSRNGYKPFYEAYGEIQVKAGLYSTVLRYQEHILPLAEELDSYVRRVS